MACPPLVLVVEDHQTVREFIAAALRSNGYAVLAASDPAKAIRLAEVPENVPALVICGASLPGMSGLQLAGILLAKHPAARVLVVSGFSEEAVLTQTPPAGTGFLQKPFTIESLLAKVRETLDQGCPP